MGSIAESLMVGFLGLAEGLRSFLVGDLELDQMLA